MRSKELLGSVMQELELEEKRKVNGGSAYSTARGLACIYGGIMGGKGYGCAKDWFALNPSGATTGSGVCTHR